VTAALPLSLAYGEARLDLPLRAGFRVLTPRSLPSSSADTAATVASALAAPIGSPPLAATVRVGDMVTIVVSDGTRVTGAREVLPVVLRELERAGVSGARVRILFALGIHRRQTAVERAALVGPEVAAQVACIDHDCDDDAAHTPIANDGPATGIRLNRHVLDGGPVIVTGAIGFHYLAGFGGGRKSLLPGVAARASVRAFHSLSLDPTPGAGRHPCVAPAVRAGNPMDALAGMVAALVPRTFLVNTIMANGIAAVFAGDVAQAFDAGTEQYRRWFTVPIPARRPVVIVSAGGAPRDCDLVQSQKAIAAAAAALAPGGRMLVLAACREGLGHAELAPWFDQPDRASHVAALRARFSVPGQTALALREHAERFRISLLSELPADVVARTGMTPIAHPDEFLAAVAREHGADVEGYVLPAGGRYLPVVENGG
jgi:lactate racemase